MEFRQLLEVHQPNIRQLFVRKVLILKFRQPLEEVGDRKRKKKKTTVETAK